MHRYLDIAPEVREALDANGPVVALETTVIAHGLPRPRNLDTAHAMRSAVVRAGAVPAFVGLRRGRIRIGLDDEDIAHFARDPGITKASRRDLPALVALGGDGATTVAGTIACAAAAGIPLLATGGIGGVHRGAEETFDVSADLSELARTAIGVVCSGAKSVLDIPKTLEALETAGVAVVGFATERFPAFYAEDSGQGVPATVRDPEEAARVLRSTLELSASGIVIANAVDAADIEGPELEAWTAQAIAEARARGVTGKDLTPFLLARVAELSAGRTLAANERLLEHNAATAARIAVALSRLA